MKDQSNQPHHPSLGEIGLDNFPTYLTVSYTHLTLPTIYSV